MIGLLVNCLEFVLNTLYRNRLYPRFFVLETVARVPYFAFTSVLHLYETFGWWRKADWLKVHFAESWNELHHLLIIESLEGNKYSLDRWVAHLGAFFYYWILVAVFMISPQSAYRFTQLVEEHAYHTYDAFLKKYSESLKGMPAPQIAIDYYRKGDLYMFDEFQTSHPPQERRPQIENLYDTFVAIRDDEGEHVKTMKACQEPRAQANFKSPHSLDRQPLAKGTKIPHLVKLFRQDSNWLVRYSIFAAINFTNYPEILLEFCTLGLKGDDPLVKQVALASLEQLAKTPQESIALELLLPAANSEQGSIRAQVARVLRHFDDPRAQAALMNLRQDPDHRVVGATLEGLV